MAVKSKLTFKNCFFFLLGILSGLAVLAFILLLIFEVSYRNKIYPGVRVSGVLFGGASRKQVENHFNSQGGTFNNLTFTLVFEDKIATMSGESLNLGYDSQLLAEQAFLIGRSGSFFTSLYQKWQALSGEINLPPSFRYNQDMLNQALESLSQQIDIPAQDALFQFYNGRVSAFQPSSPGRMVNKKMAEEDFRKLLAPPTSGTIRLLVTPVEPKVTTQQANNLGIKELLGEGKSSFGGSISNRAHNIALGASRLHGALIAPGEVFSFNNTIGEVSAKTGYKQAYVIKQKRTVLDDGGGVCQVSTTLFRAALNAGLPIDERHQHAYRVSFYEQKGVKAGLDAAVFSPVEDLKFKNDTPAYILIQASVDLVNDNLFLDLYGTSDGRQVLITNHKVWGLTPPPPDLYQDDPTLPKGEIKQIDFAAGGAKTSFDWHVERNGEVLQNRTFYSNFAPWQAIYLRGTKE
jgi:vancomycin resistance protein YoaR